MFTNVNICMFTFVTSKLVKGIISKFDFVFLRLKFQLMTTKQIVENYSLYKEEKLFGRYITQNHIQPLLDKWSGIFEIKQLGYSENNLPIHLIKLGSGSKRLLFWSQMHGNESTTTKALFDVLNFLNNDNEPAAQKILRECTLYIIPMLNPDGAQAYTRANYNKIDLNRDAQNCSQIESQIFKNVVDQVKPLVAFNLHGQRTIFSAGNTNNSAIVSFLSPASDANRTVTESRKKGMQLIVAMNKALQTEILNCVGRYDDSFNINCTGDTMEFSGYTTILFEAGHHPNDYDREITRKWMYLSLITALQTISEGELITDNYKEYFNIPENEKLFKDIIIKYFKLENEKVDVSIQYKEELIGGELQFIPEISAISSAIKEFGHLELNADNQIIEFSTKSKLLKVGEIIEYLSIENEKFAVFPIKK